MPERTRRLESSHGVLSLRLQPCRTSASSLLARLRRLHRRALAAALAALFRARGALAALGSFAAPLRLRGALARLLGRGSAAAGCSGAAPPAASSTFRYLDLLNDVGVDHLRGSTGLQRTIAVRLVNVGDVVRRPPWARRPPGPARRRRDARPPSSATACITFPWNNRITPCRSRSTRNSPSRCQARSRS